MAGCGPGIDVEGGFLQKTVRTSHLGVFEVTNLILSSICVYHEICLDVRERTMREQRFGWISEQYFNPFANSSRMLCFVVLITNSLDQFSCALFFFGIIAIQHCTGSLSF